MGIEVNKIRILARHSGEAILRYVADAPLKSLRSDLGLGASTPTMSSSASSFGTGSQSSSSSTLVHARLRKLETAMMALQSDLQSQAQDLVGLAAGFAKPDDRVFIQNTATATVHYAKQRDDGHTICGWRFAPARMKTAGLPYRFVPCLNGIPGTMLCERYLPTERAVALALGGDVPLDIELSGDE